MKYGNSHLRKVFHRFNCEPRQAMKSCSRINRLKTLIPWWQRSYREENIPSNQSEIARGPDGRERAW